MNITEQEVLNLLTTQRLSNENFQLRDVIMQLNAENKQLKDQLAEKEEQAEE